MARLDYRDAEERAEELRTEAEAALETSTEQMTEFVEHVEGMTGDVGKFYDLRRPAIVATGAFVHLLRAATYAVLEVGARLELLELESELAREDES